MTGQWLAVGEVLLVPCPQCGAPDGIACDSATWMPCPGRVEEAKAEQMQVQHR